MVVATFVTEGVRGTLCNFRRVTGVPCPTCGATRGVERLARGDLVGAWLMNPLLFTLLGALLVLVVHRAVTGTTLTLSLSPRERRAAWWLAGLALAANWAYVIARSG